MEQMKSDWNSLQNEKELKILHKHLNIIKYILVITSSNKVKSRNI